jgi:hypothetical protein
MNRKTLAEYGGHILPDGTLEMRDPNDNARHRYQYRLVDGAPVRRTLPDRGDYDPPAQWEPMDLTKIPRVGYNPISDYFGADPIKQYLSDIGRKGGKSKSARKLAAQKRNCKKGGWPKGRPRKPVTPP